MTKEIFWQEKEIKGTKVDATSTIQKGPKEKMKEYHQRMFGAFPNREEDVHITLEEPEGSFIKLGNSKYDIDLIYRVLDEMTGKDLLLKSGLRPKKKFLGETIVVKATVFEKEGMPLFFWKDDGIGYAIAPCIEAE
jgi:hypothetical protein